MMFISFSRVYRMTTFLVLTMLLIGIEVAITHAPAFSRHPTGVSLAVVFDLVCVTTGLFYWLVARPRRLTNIRLVVVALLMVRVALFIIPESAFPATHIDTALLVLAEGSVLIISGLRINTIRTTYRQLRPKMEAQTALHGAIASVFGDRAAGFILGEGLTFYYVLLGWRLRSDLPTGAYTLTTHRQSGQVALTVGLLLVGLIEAVVLHLLLMRWSDTGAGWVTALSIYGLLFFVADLIATIKRPSYLTPNQLNLRLGIRWRAQIPCSVIADVVYITEKLPKQPGRINGAFLTAANVCLMFHHPVDFTGPFGIRKTVRQVTFFVDDRATFVQALRERQPV